jgi:hypothetical protein
MTISTYTELKDAVANWTARADLATGGTNVTRVDEILDNAEALLNRELRTLDQETKNAAFSITGEYVAVPTGFLEARSFYLNTSTRGRLQFMDPEKMNELYPAGSGQPQWFSVIGGNFRFAPIPDATYAATLIYYTIIPALTGSNTTNWLLSSHPDVYLAACRYYAYDYIGDTDKMTQQLQAFQALMKSLQRSSDRNRWGGPAMYTRPG